MSKRILPFYKSCEGYRRHGGGFAFGPPVWVPCKNKAIVMMKVRQEGAVNRFPACQQCLDEANATLGIKVLDVKPIEPLQESFSSCDHAQAYLRKKGYKPMTNCNGEPYWQNGKAVDVLRSIFIRISVEGNWVLTVGGGKEIRKKL